MNTGPPLELLICTYINYRAKPFTSCSAIFVRSRSYTGPPVQAMAPIENPVVGELLFFIAPGFKVYDDFPTGAPFSPYVAFVNYYDAIRVEEVREGWYPLPRRRVGRRGRRGPPQELLYVGVRFTSDNGTVLWATFSRGDTQFMEVFEGLVYV